MEAAISVENPRADTAARRVRQHGPAVATLYERGLTWVAVSPMADRACRMDFSIRKLPSLGLVCGFAQGVRHDRMAEHVGDGNDDFSLHLNFTGCSLIEGRSREIALRPGDAVLLNYAETRAITRPDRVRYGIVRVPRATLAPLVRNVDDVVFRPIARNTGALTLLAHYASGLMSDPALAGADIRRLVVGQLSELIALTVGATREAEQIAAGRGLRVARLRAIKDDIDAHLTDGDLTPAALAGRHRISESYIRKLFESEGTSFTQYVLARRLAQAHRMLCEARYAERGIAVIAFDCGFGDLSYFNRTFRRTYGLTPSELRGH